MMEVDGMTKFERNHKSRIDPHFIIERTIGGVLAIIVPASFLIFAYIVIDFVIKALNNGICTYAVCY